MAVLMTVGGTGVVLSETVKQDGVAAAQPADHLVRDNSSDKRSLVPPGYAAPMAAPPNPDAPARSQLDPGLRYVGP